MKFKYKITKEFIEYRNKRKELFEKSNKRRKDNRTETIKLMHADCELLEYVVCEMKLHKNANTSKFDTISEIYNRCEFKCTGDSGTVTLKPFCLEQDFDHFVIWEFVTPHDRPLVEGDEVEMRILEITPRLEFLARSRVSKYNQNDYYVFAKRDVHSEIHAI